MMRNALVAVIAVATVAFVVGSAIERNSGESRASEPAKLQERHSEGSAAEPGREGGEPSATQSRAGGREAGESEFRPFGTDVEAPVFVALAAIASVALAAAAWLRPRAIGLLVLVAVAMLGFAALDIQEVVHQADEANGGLAILAGCVATLRVAAAALAAAMVRDARRAAASRSTRPLRSGA